MRIALIMNDNSYAGREYLKAITGSNISIEVICIGKYPEVDKNEEIRCGGLWTPPSMDSLCKNLKKHNFSSLNDSELLLYLEQSQFDLAIQGGTGILSERIIHMFELGILNFHPGDLPKYRGCSAPEWQIVENHDVICTCHLIDGGIDTGKIYKKKKLFNKDVKNYHKMRSLIYPKIAEFVVEVLDSIDTDFINECQEQDETEACYRKYIGDKAICDLIRKMR